MITLGNLMITLGDLFVFLAVVAFAIAYYQAGLRKWSHLGWLALALGILFGA